MAAGVIRSAYGANNSALITFRARVQFRRKWASPDITPPEPPLGNTTEKSRPNSSRRSYINAGVMAVARSNVSAGKFQKLRLYPRDRRSSGLASYQAPVDVLAIHASATDEPATFSM